MMEDASFEALKVTASVAPHSADWPKADYSGVSLVKGEKPTSSPVEIHWDRLHGAVDEARTRTLKAIGTFAGIDGNKKLSPDGKREEKQKAAQAALAGLEKSGALDKARAAVEQQVKRWDKDLAPPPVGPVVAAEIRKHIAALKQGDRLPFASTHIVECAPAILEGPAFLSGLTPAEQDIVRRQYETKMNPEVAEAKAQALAALAHCEAGWRNAANTIRTRAGLEAAPSNGMAAAAA